MNCLHNVRALVVLQLLAFWPVWRWYAERMLDGSDEPWGIVALLTALAVLATQKRERSELKTLPIFGIILLGLVYALCFPMLPALLRGVIAMGSLLLSLACLGVPSSVFLGVGGLLILSLPIIASLQFYLGYPIRVITTHLVAEMLSAINVPVDPQGTLLLWRGEVLSVDAPCSGVKMLWTGLYVSFSLSCFLKLGPFRTWLSYVFSCLMVFMGNLLRTGFVFCLEMGMVHLPFDAHMATGLVLFTLVAMLIVIFQFRFMRRFSCVSA